MKAFDPTKFTVTTAKPLPVVLLLDISGSMCGQKIAALNQAVREMLDTFRKEGSQDHLIMVSVITFGGGSAIHTVPTAAALVVWKDLQADGATPMGEAFAIAKKLIEDKEAIPSRAYRPTVVLVSDGQPTDEWQGPLNAFIKDGRSAKCDRMSMAIGSDADESVLSTFIAGTPHPLYRAANASQIYEFFRRVSLTRKLWVERFVIAKIYKEVGQYADDEEGRVLPFHIQQTVLRQGREGSLVISLERTGRAYFNLHGFEFASENCPDFAKYLTGGWLEEYVYLILKPLLKQGVIRDLRVGLHVGWDLLSSKQHGPIQEFDVTLTDGKRLFVVECKAGAVYNDHVYKLEACVRKYGGIDARGIMACAFRPNHPITRKRLESAGNLAALYEGDVTNRLADLIVAESS